MSAYIERVESLAETRAEERRTFSDEHVTRLTELKNGIEKLLAGHAAVKGVDIGTRFHRLEIAKRRAQQEQ